MAEEQELPEYDMNLNAQRHDAVYLRREKESPPCLNPPKHPHGSPPPNTVHPASGQSRPLTYGNDNSSVNRQSRVQSTRPDPIPGAPYAGAAGQRMGSAGLRKFNSGALSNKSDGTETSAPPSAFQKPHNRFVTGLSQLQSQLNPDFLPPMPRPPLYSTW